MNQKLVNLMADLMEDETIALVKDLIKQGTDPMSILDDARSAMEVVGKRFENCEYFIPDLMMAGEIIKEISDIVKPLLTEGQASAKKGKVLIGTVAGDIHDIGKDIVTFISRSVVTTCSISASTYLSTCSSKKLRDSGLRWWA